MRGCTVRALVVFWILCVSLCGYSNRATAFDANEVIEVQIGDAFNGWHGKTIVKLINGQIWDAG